MLNRHSKALELDKILKMLSDCASIPDAKELALSLEPVSMLYDANALINQTNAAYVLMAKYGSPSFGAVKNVNSALSRGAAGGMLSLRELLDIAEVLRVIRSVYEWRFNNPGSDSCLDVFFSSLIPNKQLEDSITSAILSEEDISDHASPALADIRRKIRNRSQSIREKLDSMIHSSHYQKILQEAIITQRNGRFVIPVKNEHRSEVPGLVHDTSGSGATVFIEPMAVVEANNEIKVLESKEKEEIDRIISELSAMAGDYGDTIKHNYESLVELNLIFAKAQLGYKMKASVPILNASGKIDLKKARHPLLDQKKVVPTDIYLGMEFDTLVITGPNTGGKTVSIKTLGLLTLMAQCGLLIPAYDNSEICVFQKVFADIGDEQSIEQSLSTFSSHMVNIVSILENSDENSLVLIDELGAGTDPVEGAALATAVLERLHINEAKVAATTHYAELKTYALQTPRVENACCEFDVNTLRPTYRLLIGVPGRSNAFAISEKLGMDKEIIERAKQFVSEESTRFENVVDSLERARLSMESEKERADGLRREYEEKLKQAQDKLKDADSLLKKEYEKAQSEALKISESARREANALLLEVEKLRKEMKTTADAGELARRAKQSMKKGLNELDRAINPVTTNLYDDDDYVLPRQLISGDSVFITDLGKEAKVLSPADRKGNVEVLSGSARMRVKLSSLRLIEKKKTEKKEPVFTRNTGTESNLTASADSRCDLRGMTADEAILTLDSFLDSMLMRGIGEFTVIHGKGTGVLRKAVSDHLRGNKFVKSYRLGSYGEGENGVTIVTLK
ncbi:MAG: endonuclease MutS2 [Oscillospiraceae bacterium]|nr:endonuclease MutS2 [Oscillospiraceae bacterium]